MTRGFVYFAGHGKEIKIGKSKNPKQRMTELNGGNPRDIILYAQVATADYGDLERRMHEHFSECRIKREWFTLSHELRFVISELMKNLYPTELDLGIIIGEYTSYKHPIADNASLYRHTRSLELREQELWALSYAIRSLGMHNYPAFQDRYAEARQLVVPLLDNEVPMFIRKGSEPLEMATVKIETDKLPLVNINDSQDAA